MTSRIEISYKTILFIVFLVFGFWFIAEIKDILITLFVSFIFISALGGLVAGLERLRLPRGIAILIIYCIVIVIIGTFLKVIFPPLINESVKLAKKTPQYTDTLLYTLNINPEMVTQQVSTYSSSAINVLKSIFSDIFAIISTMVITFYLLLERKNIDLSVIQFFGQEKGGRIKKKLYEIENRLGGWVRGQVLLCTVIGVMTYVGLKLLGTDYALPLALIAGILEIVPIVGPIISAIPAVAIALITSPNLALATIALYTIVQQLENHLIVPTVMKTAVGLKPLVTIIALMIGGKLLGVTGALLSIPILIVIIEIVNEIMLQKGILQKDA